MSPQVLPPALSGPLASLSTSDAGANDGAFQGLLDSLGNGEATTEVPARPGWTNGVRADVAGKATAPTTLPPEDTTDTGAKPGLVAPQVLPGTPAKDTAPPVWPGLAVDDAKSTPEVLPPEVQLPEVLPGPTPKTAGPDVLPAPPAKTDQPQVLPGPAPKTAGPQVLPGTAPKTVGPEILPGQPTDPKGAFADDRTTLPPPAPEVAAKIVATPVLPALLRPETPPPLRPASERTARTTDGKSTAATTPSGTTPAPETTLATASTPPTAPVTATATVTDPAARPVEASAVATVVPDSLGDDTPTETPTPGGEATAHAEGTVATARDLSLSTLSRVATEATAQIAAQIIRKLEGRTTRFEMALTPDDLGRVDVKLDIDAEGRLNARLAFDNPAAATDLRGRVDDLRRQLEAAGFQMAEDAFEFTDRDASSFAFDRGQQDRGAQNRAFASAARRNAEIDVAQPPRWMTLNLSPSGVDMKV